MASTIIKQKLGKIAGELFLQLMYWDSECRGSSTYKANGNAFSKSNAELSYDLTITEKSLRTARNKFCECYKTQTVYKEIVESEQDEFNGRLFLAYYNRRDNKMYYRANIKLITVFLEDVQGTVAEFEKQKKKNYYQRITTFLEKVQKEDGEVKNQKKDVAELKRLLSDITCL